MYLPKWRNLVKKGRIRQQKIQRPTREMLLLKYALQNARYRYWIGVSFWNHYFTGKHDNLTGGYQWVDYVIHIKGKGAAILLFPPGHAGGGPHEYEVRSMEQKKKYLEEKGIPYKILSRHFNSQEYEIIVRRWVLQLTKGI